MLVECLNGVQTKNSSLIIIMALNVDCRRAKSTVAMVFSYKWCVLEDATKSSLLIEILGSYKTGITLYNPLKS